MADIACTKSTIAAFNSRYTLTKNAADADVNDTAQNFTYTPTKAGSRILVFAEVANTNGAVVISAAAGDFHMGGTTSISCTQNVTTGFVLEDAKMKSKAGVMTLTATPASGKKLLTDHTLKITVVELPG